MSNRIEELVESIKRKTTHYADQDFYDIDIERILKEFAIEMCEKQKLICASYVQDDASVVVVLESSLPKELC